MPFIHFRAIGCIGTVCEDGRCCKCPICEPEAAEECCPHHANMHTAGGCQVGNCPCY